MRDALASLDSVAGADGCACVGIYGVCLCGFLQRVHHRVASIASSSQPGMNGASLFASALNSSACIGLDDEEHAESVAPHYFNMDEQVRQIQSHCPVRVSRSLPFLLLLTERASKQV